MTITSKTNSIEFKDKTGNSIELQKGSIRRIRAKQKPPHNVDQICIKAEGRALFCFDYAEVTSPVTANKEALVTLLWTYNTTT